MRTNDRLRAREVTGLSGVGQIRSSLGCDKGASNAALPGRKMKILGQAMGVQRRKIRDFRLSDRVQTVQTLPNSDLLGQ